MSENVSSWPIVPGSYVVGDHKAPVAVCTLTTERLMRPLANLPGVAISGMVYTANLGITRIIQNIISNPAIRFLLVCGRDSPLFKPGQSIVSLSDRGMDNNKRIIGATGYEPVLQSLAPDQIERFRKQIEVVDWTGEEDIDSLKQRINDLSARSPGGFAEQGPSTSLAAESFAIIRPGGQREPLIYDPKGYFVISVEPDKEEIVLRHYLPDHTPRHEMRGRGASSMLLGLIRDGLVTQLSHAGYLGEELAKAQTALQFGMRYDQDRPLRQREVVATNVETATVSKASENMPASPEEKPQTMKPQLQPLTLTQFEESIPGARVDIVLSVTHLLGERVLSGVFLESDEAEPFTAYHRREHNVEVSWAEETRVIMGQENEIQPGALLRIVGKLGSDRAIDGEQIVILTRAARVVS